MASEFKAPDPLKSEERGLSDAMTSMIDMMSRMYKNQVLLEMNKGTIDKFAGSVKSFGDSLPSVLVNRSIKFIDGYSERKYFEYLGCGEYSEELTTVKEPVYNYKDELKRIDPRRIVDTDRLQFSDAQTGNYAAVLTKLAAKMQKKLFKRFSNKRIKALSQRVLSKNDARSKRLFYERISKQMAIDPLTLMKKDGMTYDFNALVIETSRWAEKLRDETLEMYTANTLRAMTTGESLDSILSQYDDMVEKRRNHSEFTARNQITSFNSIMNKTRAQKLGVKKAVWISSSDERTRPSHEWRNGKEFDLNEGLYSSMDGKTLLPGTDYQCRCNYRFVLDEEE